MDRFSVVWARIRSINSAGWMTFAASLLLYAVDQVNRVGSDPAFAASQPAGGGGSGPIITLPAVVMVFIATALKTVHDRARP